ncbi:hypothetical protein R5R35_009886 [Gryllus longicercus]|uniref:DUF4817 domain-containing protein n=1 Tax=Gryllus longicercus TaxID=2509291 RepID=A0AAN9ZDU6_9ORTH
MENFDVPMKVKIVKEYFKTKSVSKTQENFETFPGTEAPIKAIILSLVKKFEDDGDIRSASASDTLKDEADSDTSTSSAQNVSHVNAVPYRHRVIE